MSNNDELNKITNPVVKGKTPIYHLINEEKLNDLKNNSIAQDILMLFSSIFLGAFISSPDFLPLFAGFICLGFALYFYIRKNTFIKSIKSSGEIKSFESTKNKNDLKIIEAIYGTPPDKIIDITQELNNNINNNILRIRISNEIKGDPNKGVVKSLEIKYKIGNKTIQKSYKEGELVEIP